VGFLLQTLSARLEFLKLASLEFLNCDNASCQDKVVNKNLSLFTKEVDVYSYRMIGYDL